MNRNKGNPLTQHQRNANIRFILFGFFFAMKIELTKQNSDGRGEQNSTQKPTVKAMRARHINHKV